MFDPKMLPVELAKWYDEKYCLEQCEKDFPPFINIKVQTPEIHLLAVTTSGAYLRHIHNQTEKLCLAAVRNCGTSIRYVKKQTYKICLEAVRQNGLALEYVLPKFKTTYLCLIALRHTGTVLVYIDQTAYNVQDLKKIYKTAVKENGHTIQYISNKTEELCILAVKQNGHAIQYINDQTEKLCWLALKNSNGFAIQYIHEPTDKMHLEAVRECGQTIQFIKHQTEKLCLIAINQNVENYLYCKINSKRIVKAVLKKLQNSLNDIDYDARKEIINKLDLSFLTNIEIEEFMLKNFI
jgi:hypothetical protein